MPYETLQNGGATTADAADRRRSARQQRQVPAWLSNASGGGRGSAQQEVIVSNLSLHGVGFTAEQKVEMDDAHWIVIASNHLSLSTRLRIISVRENSDGKFDVGAEFF